MTPKYQTPSALPACSVWVRFASLQAQISAPPRLPRRAAGGCVWHMSFLSLAGIHRDCWEQRFATASPTPGWAAAGSRDGTQRSHHPRQPCREVLGPLTLPSPQPLSPCAFAPCGSVIFSFFFFCLFFFSLHWVWVCYKLQCCIDVIICKSFWALLLCGCLCLRGLGLREADGALKSCS